MARDNKDQQESSTVGQNMDSDLSFLQSWRLFVVTLSLCLGAVLYGLDMNIIGVAAPVITREFHSLEDVSWYSASYLLTITAFQPCFGNVYKYFSVKAVFVGSIVIFESEYMSFTQWMKTDRWLVVGSIICATARSSAILIFGRAFLGFGASGLLQGALGIVSYIVRLEKVPMYQGFVAGAAAVSATAGPVIGGGLTDSTGWRWCFWINVPLGAAILVPIGCFVVLSSETNKRNRSLPIAEKLKHLDPIGTILFLGSIVSLLLALQWGNQKISWDSATSIGLFFCFGIGTIAFTTLQWRLGEYATIPFRVIRIRSIYMGALVLFTLGVASISLAFYLPLYFQATQGASATGSGINMIAYVAPTIVSIGATGGLVSRYGHYVPYMVVGITIASIAAGFLTLLDAYTPTATWAGLIVVNRLGMGMAQQLPYTALQAVLEPEDIATGNAIAIFSWQLGGAIAVSIGQNLLLNTLKISIPAHTTEVGVQQVIDAGAGGINSIAPDGAVLKSLREAYAEALRGSFVLALVSTCLALPFAAGMQWLNIKRVAEERRVNAREGAVDLIRVEEAKKLEEKDTFYN
ncbi:hypothetical protein HBI12_213810 [Parastagonospora nodorum]|nr:hypothetical protein HBI12_213810 [Parastagonospora nodorum]